MTSKILLYTDSRGKLIQKEDQLSWTTIIERKLKNIHQIDNKAWEFGGALTKLEEFVETGNYDIVISQILQLEMCLGPLAAKYYTFIAIPDKYKSMCRLIKINMDNDKIIGSWNAEEILKWGKPLDNVGHYNSFLDCQEYVKTVLNNIEKKCKHIAITPTRNKDGINTWRTDLIRKILNECCSNVVNLPIDNDSNLLTYDSEHYTQNSHQMIADKIMDKLNA